MFTKRQTIFPSISNLPRNNRRFFESMNHQSKITLKPGAVPTLLLSHFKSNNSPKNLNKKSLLNTNIIREACQHATKMITKNTSSSSMPRRTPRQPSILHLIVPNNGGIQDTFFFKEIFRVT
ncbi:hypothetical protein AAZV13_17G207350 [Glycine max]